MPLFHSLSLFLFCTVVAWLSVHAQSGEVLPELDVHYRVQQHLRLWLQVKGTREGGAPSQAEIGPSLDFYLKPWVKLNGAAAFDVDESKSRPLVLSIGYRYLGSSSTASENRLEAVATGNVPLKGELLLSDRNRFDFDWQVEQYSWRYRNRVSFARAIRIRGYHPRPYVSAEFFYDSKYSKWSDTALYAGCFFPVRRHIQFDVYYEHQNNTGKAPNQQLNQLGLALNLLF